MKKLILIITYLSFAPVIIFASKFHKSIQAENLSLEDIKKFMEQSRVQNQKKSVQTATKNTEDLLKTFPQGHIKVNPVPNGTYSPPFTAQRKP